MSIVDDQVYYWNDVRPLDIIDLRFLKNCAEEIDVEWSFIDRVMKTTGLQDVSGKF
jgi:hypothetical protein